MDLLVTDPDTDDETQTPKPVQEPDTYSREWTTRVTQLSKKVEAVHQMRERDPVSPALRQASNEDIGRLANEMPYAQEDEHRLRAACAFQRLQDAKFKRAKRRERQIDKVDKSITQKAQSDVAAIKVQVKGLESEADAEIKRLREKLERLEVDYSQGQQGRKKTEKVPYQRPEIVTRVLNTPSSKAVVDEAAAAWERKLAEERGGEGVPEAGQGASQEPGGQCASQ